MILNIEEWKDVVGSKGNYQISSFGRCRSIAREKEGVILCLSNYKDKYLFIIFSMRHFKMNCRINILVAEYFLDNPEGFKFVRNKDGDFRNNCVDNLEWCKKTDVLQRAILEESEVLEIYDALNDEETCTKLGKKYGVCLGTIVDIKNGRCWKKLIRDKRDLYVVKGCFNTPMYDAITKKCSDCEYKYGLKRCENFKEKNLMKEW